MLKQIHNKISHHRLIVAILLFFSIVLVWFTLIIGRPQENLEVSQGLDFQTEVGLFERFVKNAWHQAETNDPELAGYLAHEALLQWQAIDRNFVSIDSPAYAETVDWQAYVYNIGNHMRRADELAKEKNLPEAGSELRSALVLLGELKHENGIDDTTAELLDFYELVRRIDAAPSKEALEPYLAELKLAFAFLKEAAPSKVPVEILEAMEREIAKIDMYLYGPDLKKARSELKRLFFEIFLI